jgi:hypothetical protein
MHLYNCVWVVLLIPRLNLPLLSPKLSRGIDIVLVYHYPCGFDNPTNTLRWNLLQLAYICLWIILLGLRTTNNELTEKFGNSAIKSSSRSHMASSFVSWFHWTLHILMVLFLVTLSDVSKTFIWYSWYSRSSPVTRSTEGTFSSSTYKHFFNWHM